jgi:ribosomal protein L4
LAIEHCAWLFAQRNSAKGGGSLKERRKRTGTGAPFFFSGKRIFPQKPKRYA